MRQSPDAYFVKVDHGPPVLGAGGPAPVGRAGLGSSGPTRRRRRRRPSGGRVFLAIIVLGIGGWLAWAAQRPGGVSGSVNGWISHVRGDVAKVSADPDLGTARAYYAKQYKKNGEYPHLSEADLGGVGIGVGVTVDWCGPQAVVIEGQAGGGPSSRLLLSGRDLGAIAQNLACPTNLADPAPWKLN